MIQRILVGVLALTAAATTASASITTYGSQALLETSNTDLTFQNISFSAYVGQSLLTSITTGGVTFTATSGSFSVLSNTLLQADSGGTVIHVSFASTTVRAFGLSLNNLSGQAYPIGIDFTGDGSTYGNSISPAYFAARVTNNVDGQITGLTFTPFGSQRLQLSSFETGTGSSGGGGGAPPSETPEPTTLVLIGGGLAGFGMLKRRGLLAPR